MPSMPGSRIKVLQTAPRRLLAMRSLWRLTPAPVWRPGAGQRAASSWAPRVADAAELRLLRGAVEKSAAVSAVTADVGQTNSLAPGAAATLGAASGPRSSDTNRIPVDELRGAVDALRCLPEGDEASPRLQHMLMESFEAAIPELLQRGECLALVLQLPLSDAAERPLKRLLLFLSRRLRRAGAHGLPAAELPHVPRLLQRLGLCDDALFEDWCVACARFWPALDEDELCLLFRRTEDYALLHPTRGPALVRLIIALAESIPVAGEQRPSPVALASLAHAALGVRQREFCRPLLERLRAAFETEASDPSTPPSAAAGGKVAAAAAAALAGAAELHSALGGPSEHLLRLAERAREGLAGARRTIAAGKQPAEDVPAQAGIIDEHTAALLRACSHLHWHMPQVTCALFEALLDHLSEGALHHSMLNSCRHLPAPLRRQLVGHLLQSGSPADIVVRLDAEELETWLRLVHDLPAAAKAAGDIEGVASLAALARAMLEELLGTSGILADGSIKCGQVRRSALVAAHLAASSVGYSLAGFNPPLAADTPTTALMAHLSERALVNLDTVWADLSPQDVQTLFRCPGDCSELIRMALGRLDCLGDPLAQAAVLTATAAALPGEDLTASRRVLLRRTTEGAHGAAKLCTVEAALRRGLQLAWGSEVAGAQLELLAGLRQQAFRATLAATPAWSQRPARGYMRYVEQCLERARRAPALAWKATQSSAGTLTTAAEAKTARAESTSVQQQPTERQLAARPSLEAPAAPERYRGVAWHRGMEGWEVRLEAQGRRVLGGYFVPRDDSAEEVERARLAAVECHRSLEWQHLRRPRAEAVQ